jgi:hypothetical protein
MRRMYIHEQHRSGHVELHSTNYGHNLAHRIRSDRERVKYASFIRAACQKNENTVGI